MAKPRCPDGRVILALDPSSQTGFALSTGHSGVFDLRDLPDLGHRVFVFQWWLKDLILRHGVRLLGIERPFINTRSESGLLPGYLVAAAHAVAHGQNVERDEVPQQTWRKAILGNGGLSTAAAKKAALRWCEDRGHNPVDHNEAEALCILQYFSQKRALTTREMDEVS